MGGDAQALARLRRRPWCRPERGGPPAARGSGGRRRGARDAIRRSRPRVLRARPRTGRAVPGPRDCTIGCEPVAGHDPAHVESGRTARQAVGDAAFRPPSEARFLQSAVSGAGAGEAEGRQAGADRGRVGQHPSRDRGGAALPRQGDAARCVQIDSAGVSEHHVPQRRYRCAARRRARHRQGSGRADRDRLRGRAAYCRGVSPRPTLGAGVRAALPRPGAGLRSRRCASPASTS